MRNLGQRQHGDTIVEVLIAIAVVSVLLAGAFVSARRSSTAAQQSQERVEALKFVEEQLEQLKAIAEGDASDTIFDAAAPTIFCFSKVDRSVRAQADLTPALLADPATIDFDKYQATCRYGPNDRYRLAIERTTGTSNTFIVTAYWDRFGGGGREVIRMVYRVHPS